MNGFKGLYPKANAQILLGPSHMCHICTTAARGRGMGKVATILIPRYKIQLKCYVETKKTYCRSEGPQLPGKQAYRGILGLCRSLIPMLPSPLISLRVTSFPWIIRSRVNKQIPFYFFVWEGCSIVRHTFLVSECRSGSGSIRIWF